jgi:predicted TPR repeat methyltransferase
MQIRRVSIMNTTFSTLLVVALMYFQGVRSIHGYQSLSSSQSTNRNYHSSVSSTRTTTTSRRDLLQETSTRFAASLTTLLLGFGVSPCSPASALTPSEASQAYNSYASNYDDLDGGSAANVLGIPQARSQLLAKASGKVLEIGAGTGLNLANYNIAQIESLTLLDVSHGMLEQARNRYSDDKRWKAAVTNNDSPVAVNFVQGDATSELVQRFGAESFDTVVDSFSLCVMGTRGAQQCLDQIRRVTKPRTGKILLLEN